MPFFTPLWAGIPTFMLIFQLAREVWWYESPFPFNAIGYALEPMYLMPYRGTQVLTISESTRLDLRHLGFRGPITILPIGLEDAGPTSHIKAEHPTFLYVGRMAPSKRIPHILAAFARFQQLNGSGFLWLAGSGSSRYVRSLTKLAARLKVENSVVFLGRVSSAKKRRLMTEAHVLLMTSVREGWGLVVSEANACGTPAIVYDVPGLRDAVRHEVSGLVVMPTPLSLASAMVRLINDPVLYCRLSNESQRWSATFSYDTTALLVGDVIGGGMAA